ncbi:hypothetical protein CJI97_005687 [Candidozyma auris]|nr:hypothetical protein CJI97_005687 [[Candida] auris]
MKPAARPFAWRLAVVLCRYNSGASASSKEFPQDFDLSPSMASGRSLVGSSKQPPPLTTGLAAKAGFGGLLGDAKRPLNAMGTHVSPSTSGGRSMSWPPRRKKNCGLRKLS